MTVLVEREIFDSDTSEAYLTPTDNTEIADKKDDEETSSKAESDPSTPVLAGSIHENNVEKTTVESINNEDFSKNELSESIELVDKAETLEKLEETDVLKEESPKVTSAEAATEEKIENEAKIEPVVSQDIEPIKKEIIFNHETQLKETKIEHVESNVVLETVKENDALIEESDKKEPIVKIENVDKVNLLETEENVLVKETIVNNNIAVIESILKEELVKDNRNSCDSDVISSQTAPNSPTKLSVDTASPQHDLSTPGTPAKVPDAIASSDAASTTTEATSPSQEEAPSGGPPSRAPSLGAIPDETIAVEALDPIITDNQTHRMSPHKRPHSSSTSTQVDPVHFG